ncbi:MAG: 3-oxoacyl-[acyl-carrier-protein] synthase 2 [Chlamydiae bacterium]|nr:3-oxoacyl-[acyl-carrier-protein] synthase 2 [Chlamydiota bacterium]
MARKRIVVTGMGVVSCFGNDVDTFMDNLYSGTSGVKKISHFSCEDFSTQFAAYIDNFDSEDYIDKKQARRIDKFIAYTLVAGAKALEASGIQKEHNLDPSRSGVLIGSGMGGLDMFYRAAETLKDKGAKKMSPFFIPFTITNMGGAFLAIDYGFMGPNYSVSTACATANYAFISAAQHIRKGEADLIVCGGVEATINAIGVSGFCACRALSKRNDAPEQASRPWDKGRDGFVMGEGAGVLVLESLEHALARGAPIYAEYMGGGMSCDAYHMTEPRTDGKGVVLCIEKALKDAGVDAQDVDYINAHATSTLAGDMAEISAYCSVFPDTSKIILNATKSMIGHALGAAGGLEAVATIMQMNQKKVHPTINLDDPEEGLDFIIPTEATDCDIQYGLSNSFGFGGHNASVLFAPYRG